jgi:hypothetical protein
MRIAILQPGYLPWLGFFEQMAYADCFVYFDDVQFTRKDWRSRNRVKTSAGPVWLSVPTRKAARETPIHQIEINYQERWAEKHLRTIQHAYQKTPYFEPLFGQLSQVLAREFRLLQELDAALVEVLRRHLGLDTPIRWSSELGIQTDDKNERILKICQALGADLLYDGKAAEAFVDVGYFAAHGVQVVFQDYQHPVYRQLWGEFVSHLSVVDLIMNMGPVAGRVLRQSPVPEALRAPVAAG